MGAEVLLLPAFQRAVTSNSAGTRAPEASTTASPEVPSRFRLRGTGTPERTTSLLRAIPAVSRTVSRSWDGTGSGAARAALPETPALKGPARQAVRVARMRAKRRDPSLNIYGS